MIHLSHARANDASSNQMSGSRDCTAHTIGVVRKLLPKDAPNNNRYEFGMSLGLMVKLRIRFGNGPAPATRAANLALRQRLRAEIVLTAIDR